MDMKKKICLVSGAARGIGRTISEALLAYGAERIYACDIDKEALEAFAEKDKRVCPVELDVCNVEQVEELAVRIRQESGRLDVLVNNAGITRDALLQKMSDDDWNAVIAVNLKGVFNLGRAMSAIMLENGSGSIVNIASVVGLDGNMGQSNYAATKAGVIGMAKSWAKELARKGANIRVNAVAPGFIDTPMIKHVPEKVIDSLCSRTALKRLGKPGEIAEAVTFLCSDSASFITGQVLRIDGGLSL